MATFIEMATVGSWIGGLLVGGRRRSTAQLTALTAELEAEEDRFAEQAVRYERARIARELHDIVAQA